METGHRKQYTVYQRKGRKYYYCQFLKPDGTYTAAQSTKETAKSRAERWAADYLQKTGGKIINNSKITFDQFSKDFFSWDGEWATNKRVEGKRIGQRHCKERSDVLRVHVLPALGKLNLSEIDKAILKDFRNDLFVKEYSGSLINRCLYAIKAILESAEERGLIRAVPKITRADEKPKTKGILTIDEVNRLFNVKWETIAAHCRPSKPQYIGYIGNLLAASTGLRMGEIQGILIKDLHLDNGFINIKRSWDSRLNQLNETTKTGKERNIFIPEKVKIAIYKLIEYHPCPIPDSFLFRSEKKSNEKPAENKVFIRALFNALNKIGIDDAERKRRNISFHSWRHWFNSLLINAKIPLQKIQSMTGHSTIEMTNHYYHIDDMADVRQIQESIFSIEPEKQEGAKI